jgi:hypothetical protein
MRSVMLHEADHHRFGAHTCGQRADQDDNGPFGVGAYYAALLSRQSTNLDASQREILVNFARAVTASQICGAAAQNNLFNAIDFGIFPSATSAAANPTGTGADLRIRNLQHSVATRATQPRLGRGFPPRRSGLVQVRACA